jgi:hypothetical protein
VVGAQAAHPGDAKAEPGQSDARVALGAGMVDEQVDCAVDRFARRRCEGDHRFAQCHEVVQHFGFDAYFIVNVG